MKAGRKMLDSRIEEFCRNSSELLQSIHVRCGEIDGPPENGQSNKVRKKKAKKIDIILEETSSAY